MNHLKERLYTECSSGCAVGVVGGDRGRKRHGGVGAVFDEIS